MAGPDAVDDPESLAARLGALGGGERPFRFAAGPAWRERAARRLGVLALERFEGEGSVRPWHDGAEVEARFSAAVVQACSLTLEPFGTEIASRFLVRLVPATSPRAPGMQREVEIDPEAEDPPDVLEGDLVPVGELLVEHLALEIDPFPRKPGAAFEPPPAETPLSPFAVLRRKDA